MNPSNPPIERSDSFRSAGERFRKLLSPTRSLPLSASSPSLFPGSSKSPTPSVTSPTRSIPEDQDEVDSGIGSRHYSESNVRRGGARVLSSKTMRRSNSTSSHASLDEEGIPGAASQRPCAFGEPLRPVDICLPQRALTSPPSSSERPKSETVNKGMRRLISVAKVVEPTPSNSRGVTQCEELWGMKVRYYVEHFEASTFMTVQVQDVYADGPAELNGIERNDQILAINGSSVKSMSNSEIATELCDTGHETLDLTILPEKQTKISNVQIFWPSRSSLDILWCVRNQLTILSIWDIDLSGKKEPAIAVDLSRLILINNLAVCNCRLDSLDAIKGLSRLQFLSQVRFSNNHLTASALGSDCPLSEISSIKSLQLNKNRIKDFPAITYKLPRLEHLNLAFNQLRELPRTISALENLKQLNLDGNALLEFDTTMVNFDRLKFLSISRNYIDFHPGLEKQGLSAFVVFGNPFITLPYLQSPAGRLQTRKSLRHGSTATWHRRQNKHKSSPMISPLLNTRQSHMKSSVSSTLY